MGLTIKEIDNAKPNAKLYKLADGGGLCLAVKPNGSKLWWFCYRFDGKERTFSLGEYPLVGLKEAREGHFVAGKLLDAGTDPMVARKAESEAQHKEAEAQQREVEARQREAKTASRMSPANGGNGGLSGSPHATPTTSCSV